MGIQRIQNHLLGDVKADSGKWTLNKIFLRVSVKFKALLASCAQIFVFRITSKSGEVTQLASEFLGIAWSDCWYSDIIFGTLIYAFVVLYV
jgi:hypothetical protein